MHYSQNAKFKNLGGSITANSTANYSVDTEGFGYVSLYTSIFNNPGNTVKVTVQASDTNGSFVTLSGVTGSALTFTTSSSATGDIRWDLDKNGVGGYFRWYNLQVVINGSSGDAVQLLNSCLLAEPIIGQNAVNYGYVNYIDG